MCINHGRKHTKLPQISFKDCFLVWWNQFSLNSVILPNVIWLHLFLNGLCIIHHCKILLLKIKINHSVLIHQDIKTQSYSECGAIKPKQFFKYNQVWWEQNNNGFSEAGMNIKRKQSGYDTGVSWWDCNLKKKH